VQDVFEDLPQLATRVHGQPEILAQVGVRHVSTHGVQDPGDPAQGVAQVMDQQGHEIILERIG